MFGISPKSYQLLLNTLAGFKEIEKAGIYGSRALGNYKNGSDIDLVVYGKNISQETILKLRVQLEQELPIPYFFDVTHYESISNQELKNHIDRFGQILYNADAPGFGAKW